MSVPFGSEFTRSLWTDLDHILLVYVGSAAEFALVEENHWLFFTEKLPSAPMDRLISTFVWNRKVMETTEEDAPTLARTIRGFHDDVEHERGLEEGGKPRISNHAFRAVGSMLIVYAVRAEEYLNRRQVSEEEKETYYCDQVRFFTAMGIEGWEPSYADFMAAREQDDMEALVRNDHTDALFEAYRRDLGGIRYTLLRLFMGHFLPLRIRKQVEVSRRAWFRPFYALYPVLHGTPLARLVHWLLLPKRVRRGLA